MGFSTSGAVAIILVGFLVAASLFVPTLFSIGSATGDAFSSQADDARDRSNTNVSIREVQHNASNTSEDTVNVTVANDGTITLDISKTNVLVNGELVPVNETETTVTDPIDDTSIAETLLWPPGTVLEIEIAESTLAAETDTVGTVDDVERVLIATETGIMDADGPGGT